MRRALPKKQSAGRSPGNRSEPDVLEVRTRLLGLQRRLHLREFPGWTGEVPVRPSRVGLWSSLRELNQKLSEKEIPINTTNQSFLF